MSAAPSNDNMLASITASLEKSLSLNHHHQTTTTTTNSAAFSSDSPGNPSNYSDATTTLDLNSQISLPYHWEQCLDLKSGEIYYINWMTGMKAQEDPRTSWPEELTTGTDFYYTEEEEEQEDEDEEAEEEEDEDEDDNDSRSRSSRSYDTDSEEGSSSKLKSSASPAGASSSMNDQQLYHDQNTTDHQVLVVAGCKACLMYFMVPKQVKHCPKCTTAQLLHFL